MKVLYVTNLFPVKSVPTRGIFIVNQLKILKKIGVDFKVIPLGLKYDGTLRILRRILGRSIWEVLEEFEGVRFEILFEKTFVRFLKEKVGLETPFEVSKDDSEVVAKNFARAIEDTVNVSVFDLIHAHGMYEPPAGLVAMILSEKFGKPYVITVHGSDVNILMEKRKGKYVHVLERASKVIAVSRALIDRMKAFGYSGRNSVIIPNGYDPNLFFPRDKGVVRRELNIPEGRYVGFVGGLNKAKGADFLPLIFEKVAKEMPFTSFIVIGDGELKRGIKKCMKKKLNVIFTGRVPHERIPLWLNAMDVLVVPSREEGFGIVALEARACGTCVLGSDAGGIPEVIGNRRYIVEMGDHFVERFSERIVEILSNVENLEECASDLRKNVEDFTWEAVAKRLIELYSNILTTRDAILDDASPSP